MMRKNYFLYDFYIIFYRIFIYAKNRLYLDLAAASGAATQVWKSSKESPLLLLSTKYDMIPGRPQNPTKNKVFCIIMLKTLLKIRFFDTYTNHIKKSYKIIYSAVNSKNPYGARFPFIWQSKTSFKQQWIILKLFI